jgi:hypothetical protein
LTGEFFALAFRLGCGFEGGRQSGGDIPREEFFYPVDGMLRDAPA